MSIGIWFNVVARNLSKRKINRMTLIIASLVIINIMAGILGNIPISGEEMVLLCTYSGKEEMYGMQLLSYNVSGPKDLRVGDFVVVSFVLRYVGVVKQIRLNKIFAGAMLPNNTMTEFEDRSFRGVVISTGDIIRYNKEIVLTQNGSWAFWPAFEYYNGTEYGTELVKSKQPWIKCEVKVSERVSTPTPTTTPQPLPDLTFEPQYLQGITYSNCEGFIAYIKNIGQASTNRGTTARFTITSTSGTTYVRESLIPPLAAGESVSVSTGLFIGVPGNSYTVNVQLDYGNLITESSELNNERRWTFTYRDWDLPQIDLELYNQALSPQSNGTIRFNVRNWGCLTSPPTRVRIGIEKGDMTPQEILWSGRVVELTSIQLNNMSSGEERSFSVSNVFDLIRSSQDPDLRVIRYARFHVWIDSVTLEFIVEGRRVRINETNDINNRKTILVGGIPNILGPDVYFLPKGQQTYNLYNVTGGIWPAISNATLSGVPMYYTFSIQGCGATVSYQELYDQLTINVPRDCRDTLLMLTIIVESTGMLSQKNVRIILYDVENEVIPIQGALYNACKTKAELGASEAFIFTDLPIGIRYTPLALIMPVTWTIDVNRYELRDATVGIEVSWTRPDGTRSTYRLPSSNIDIDGTIYNDPAIIFSIPRNAIFSNISTKAVRGSIKLSIVTGTQHRIERVYSLWIHDSTTYPVYLRSFHFQNTPCPSINWDMWEKFWGEDAVWDWLCILDYCWKLWHDWASDALYNYAFKEMCEEGRCSAHALVSQKFRETPQSVGLYAIPGCPRLYPYPQPFALDKNSILIMFEDPPSGSFRSNLEDLDTYLTYQYMWSLDERNLRRGTEALVRWLAGEDVILETLNELRQWERMPETQKWNDVPLLFMFSDDIRSSHTVLVYRVEEISANHVRVWVLDSNRPFQPNSAVNQDNSYVDFRCCRSDGRWYFTFYLDNEHTKVIDDFLFATGSSLFHGESAALTTGDVIFELFELFIEYMATLGYAGTSGDSNTSNRTPSLIIVGGDAGVKISNVSDVMGKKVFVFDGVAPPSIEDMSKTAILVPIPAPLANPVYVFVAGSELNLNIRSTKNGTVAVISENSNRSLSLQYFGSPERVVNLTLNQSGVRIKNNASGSYRIASSIIDNNTARQISLEVESARYNFNIDFSSGGGFVIKNSGDEPLNISVELIAHSADGQQNARYVGITIPPHDAIIASPRSWDNISSGQLVVRIDAGSDGTIDEERIVNPAGSVVTTTPSTTTVTITSTTTTTEKVTTTTTTTQVFTTTATISTIVTERIATTTTVSVTASLPPTTSTITVTTTVVPERPSDWSNQQLLIVAALAIVMIVVSALLVVKRK
ncbi:MAG: CARDB domain-containing protein [Sulfolobales archaeon]